MNFKKALCTVLTISAIACSFAGCNTSSEISVKKSASEIKTEVAEDTEFKTYSSFELTADHKNLYDKGYSKIDSMPGIPLASIAERSHGGETQIVILEDNGMMAYNGMSVYSLLLFTAEDNAHGAVDAHSHFINLVVGDSEDTWNRPDSFELTDDIKSMCEEAGVSNACLVLGTKGDDIAVFCHDNDTTVSVVSISNGEATVIETIDLNSALAD